MSVFKECPLLCFLPCRLSHSRHVLWWCTREPPSWQNFPTSHAQVDVSQVIRKAQAQTCSLVSYKMFPGESDADPQLRTCGLCPDHCCPIVSLLWLSLELMCYVLVKWWTSPTANVLERRKNLLAQLTRKSKDKFGTRHCLIQSLKRCHDQDPLISWLGPLMVVFFSDILRKQVGGQLLRPQNFQAHQKISLYFSTVWMKSCDLTFSLVWVGSQVPISSVPDGIHW